jgi:hypothetical protein
VKPPRRLPAADAAIAAAVAAGCALLGVLALGSVARPAGFGARLETLEAKAAEVAQVLRPRAETGALALDAVCTGDAAAEEERLRTSIADFGRRLNLELGAVQVRPDAPGRGGLTPLQIRFEATGSYEQVLSVLDMLSRERPQIFADSVDLTSNTSSVTLGFAGRVFCAA